MCGATLNNLRGTYFKELEVCTVAEVWVKNYIILVWFSITELKSRHFFVFLVINFVPDAHNNLLMQLCSYRFKTRFNVRGSG